MADRDERRAAKRETEYVSTIELFSRGSLQNYLQHRFEELRQAVQQKDENSLVIVNVSDYVEQLTSKYVIETPIVDVGGVTRSDAPYQVIGRMHPPGFAVDPDQSYERRLLTLHFPFKGDWHLLEYMPLSTIGSWRHKASIVLVPDQSEIRIHIIDFGDMDALKRRTDEVLRELRSIAEPLRHGVDQFNQTLEARVLKLVEERRDHIIKRREDLAVLAIPLKRVDPPPAFKVPFEKKEILVAPASPSRGLDPFLDDEAV